VALTRGEARAAERHALVDRDVVADLGRLADHHARAVVDEEAVADPGVRMDLDVRERAREEGQHARRQRHPVLLEGVRDAVRQQRLHAGPGGEDLERADPAGGRIARMGRGDVPPQLSRDAPQGRSDAEHPEGC
jgi:hypothetical protein